MGQHRSPPTSCGPSAPMTDGPSSLAGLSAFRIGINEAGPWSPTLMAASLPAELTMRQAARQARDDGHDAGNGTHRAPVYIR
jgi:hypothetical protein